MQCIFVNYLKKKSVPPKSVDDRDSGQQEHSCNKFPVMYVSKTPAASFANFPSPSSNRGKRRHGLFQGFHSSDFLYSDRFFDGCTLSNGRSGSALLQNVTFPFSSSS